MDAVANCSSEQTEDQSCPPRMATASPSSSARAPPGLLISSEKLITQGGILLRSLPRTSSRGLQLSNSIRFTRYPPEYHPGINTVSLEYHLSVTQILTKSGQSKLPGMRLVAPARAGEGHAKIRMPGVALKLMAWSGTFPI